MTRQAKLEVDAPRSDRRWLKVEEERVPGRLRTLTSVELSPEPPRRGVSAPAVVGAGPAPGDAVQSLPYCREGGRRPQRKLAVSEVVAKGDVLLPFRLPAEAVWTVVDSYQADGVQYVVVRRDEPPPSAPRALSRRESQALALAVLGHSNKVIAYEMGASASTVGVLLYRAARKLGSRTRSELLAGFLGLAANEGSPGSPHRAHA
jgi:DNA-binding CsgD family transcriptional regulator